MEKAKSNPNIGEDFGTPFSAAKKSGPLVYALESLYNIYPWCTPSLPCKEQTDYYMLTGFYVPKSSSIEDEVIGSWYQRSGFFGEAERKAAKLFGSDETLFGSQGTSLNNKTVFKTFAKTIGDNGNKNLKVLSSRDVHKSVYKAYRDNNFFVDYLPINYDDQEELFLPPSPKDVERAIEKRKYDFITLTSPSYEGLTPNLDKIIKLAHDYKIPIFIDEAWGAHLISPRLPKPSMLSGADISTQSTHKQGGGINQAAVIHFKYGLLDEKFFENLKQIHYEDNPTTSINWETIASIDAARHFLEKSGQEVLGKMVDASEDIRKRIRKIDGLTTFGREICEKHKEYVQDLDLTKITVDTTETGISGDSLSDLLWKDFRIVSERHEPRHIQFITHYRIAHNNWETYHLTDALERVVSHYRPRENNLKKNNVNYPKEVKTVRPHFEVYTMPEKNKEFVKLGNSVGRESADTVCCYPPGRYVIMEGENITQEHVNYFKEMRERGTTIHAKDHTLQNLCVVKNEVSSSLEHKRTG